MKTLPEIEQDILAGVEFGFECPREQVTAFVSIPKGEALPLLTMKAHGRTIVLGTFHGPPMAAMFVRFFDSYTDIIQATINHYKETHGHAD